MKRLNFLFAFVSFIVRSFLLPNPFECFGGNAFIINLFAEPVIQAIAFAIVGVFYNRGSQPALGSIAYLLVYMAIIGILWLCGLFSFAWWWVLILLVALAALIFGIIKLGIFINEKYC